METQRDYWVETEKVLTDAGVLSEASQETRSEEDDFDLEDEERDEETDLWWEVNDSSRGEAERRRRAKLELLSQHGVSSRTLRMLQEEMVPNRFSEY